MKRQALPALLTLLLLAALALTGTSVSTPAEIEQKEAEAQQIIAQIDQLDHDLELAVEAWNGANVKLDGIQADIGVNQRRLRIARQDYGQAQRQLQKRLVALYTSDEAGTLEVLLGAASLGDLLDRIDTVRRISDQDAQIVRDVRTARREIRGREQRLEKARAAQKRVVAEREGRKQEIERRLAERQVLYEQVADEIERLREEEARRQEELRRQALIRLQEQEEAEARAAERRQEAAGEPQPVAPAALPEEAAGPGDPAPVPAPPSAPASPPKYGGVVAIAMQYLGVPYVWGGASPSGFDCSGLIMWAYAQVGVSLPHSTGMPYAVLPHVAQSDLQPGDLVFFYSPIHHVGMYVGGGRMIDSPYTGTVVQVRLPLDPGPPT